MDLLVIAQTLQKPDKRLAEAYKTMRLTHTHMHAHTKRERAKGKRKNGERKKIERK